MRNYESDGVVVHGDLAVLTREKVEDGSCMDINCCQHSAIVVFKWQLFHKYEVECAFGLRGHFSQVLLIEELKN